MSRWAHVNGSIRINAICSNCKEGEIAEDIQKCFGTTVDFLDPAEVWDECTVPCGSEGSLQYEFIELNNKNSMNCGIVVIHGDLREYCNKQEIIDWIKKAISSSEIWWVRSLCIKIDIDYEKSIILIESDDDDKIIHILEDDRLEVVNI